MEFWKVALLVIAGVIVIALLNNQVMFATVLLIGGFIGLVIYLYMMRNKSIDPLEEFKQNLIRESFNPNNQLRYLKLSGGYENDISHQERVRGKIKGYTIITVKPSSPNYDKKNAWNTFYVIVYNQQGTSFLARLKDIVFSLPMLDAFKTTNLFAINPSQIKGNDMTFGDIVVKGTAVTTVGVFEMLNARDLDREYVMNILGRECNRLVLTSQLRKTAVLVDNAIKSDASHQKILDVIGARPQMPETNNTTFGIKMPQ